MPKNYIFGTGVLYAAPFGVAIDETHRVAAVQSASFNLTFETKEMHESGWVNLYPVANVQAGAEAKLSAEFGDLAEHLIPFLTGATKSVSGNVNTYTGSCTATPDYFQVKFVGKTSDKREVILQMARVKAPGLPLGFKRDDFVMPSIEMSALPLDATAIPWLLSIAQTAS